jgi:tight adherence protein C
MPISLILLLGLVVLAVIVGGAALVAMAQRRSVLARAGGADEDDAPVAVALRPIKERSQSRLREWLLESLPGSPIEDTAAQEKMVQAGYDTPTAPATFFLIRVAAFVVLPLATYVIAPQKSLLVFAMWMAASVFCAYIIPKGFLDRLVRQRQERIRRSVPDALDLMVVCVEAGISLDAAILRVAREVRLAHVDLAHELTVVNRKTNAGIPRDIALRGLWQRTGVEEIRALVSSMIQSEKWGTSVATVLRVSADTLRRKRRQTAEKKAKQAPLKMTLPLVLFILPALFIVIMGPALVQVIQEFGKIGQ